MKRKTALALLIGICAIGAAFAQSETSEATLTKEPSETGASMLDTVIVTASKRRESSRDVPASITALSGEQLETIGATRFEDFAQFVPGLSYEKLGGSGQQQLVLRGISTGSDSSATVGLYVDDVPVGSSSVYANGDIALDLATADLERIEVLRGPQGTLYGASTLGGLLKYVTRDPQPNTWAATLSGDLSYTPQGAFNHALRGVINLPIGESPWALRLTGSRTAEAGYIDSPRVPQENSDSATIQGARAVLLGAPTASTLLRVSALSQSIESDGVSVTDRSLQTREPVRGPYDHGNRFPEPSTLKVNLVSATLEWESPWGKLLSVSNYQQFKTSSYLDITDIADAVLMTGELVPLALVNDSKLDKLVQEFRLLSQANDRYQWIAGAFFTDEQSQAFTGAERPSGPATDLVPGSLVFTGDRPAKFREYAGFGNFTWNFNEKLDVTVGARFARNRQEFRQKSSGAVDADPVRGTNSHSTSQEDVFTWLVNPRYRINDDSMAYIRVATGYRPGGPNVVFGNANPAEMSKPADPVFKADTLINYEAGIKSTFLDGNAVLDLAVFLIDWKDIQLSVVRNNFVVRENGGTARSQGAEAAGLYRLNPALTLGLTAAYIDARLTEDTAEIPAKDGDRLPLVAEYSGTVSADYRFGLPWGLAGYAFGSYRYTGERESSFSGSASRPRYPLEAYGVVDLRLGANAKNYSVTLYGRNLLDELGEVSATSALAGEREDKPVLVALTQPRTFGVTLSYNF